MSYVPRREKLRRLRVELYEALLADGRWLTTGEARIALYHRLGAGLDGYGRLRSGWAFDVAEWVPCLGIDGLRYQLKKLHEADMVESLREPHRHPRWRAVPPEPAPDAPPADWTREPVLS